MKGEKSGINSYKSSQPQIFYAVIAWGILSGCVERSIFCYELQTTKGLHMTFHLSLQPLVAIVAGVLILAFPKVINYIIAIYLIVYGILGIAST